MDDTFIRFKTFFAGNFALESNSLRFVRMRLAKWYFFVFRFASYIHCHKSHKSKIERLIGRNASAAQLLTPYNQTAINCKSNPSFRIRPMKRLWKWAKKRCFASAFDSRKRSIRHFYYYFIDRFRCLFHDPRVVRGFHFFRLAPNRGKKLLPTSYFGICDYEKRSNYHIFCDRLSSHRPFAAVFFLLLFRLRSFIPMKAAAATAICLFDTHNWSCFPMRLDQWPLALIYDPIIMQFSPFGQEVIVQARAWGNRNCIAIGECENN